MSHPPPVPSDPKLPAWSRVHWPALLTWEFTGLSPEEQICSLQANGLTPGRALYLAMAVPPLTPEGHRERVRRAARFLMNDPKRFWPVVESLQVHWGIHPWSILGETLPYSYARAWFRELGGPGAYLKDGLRLCGLFNSWERLPEGLCVSKLRLEHLPLVRIPHGWIVEELILEKCPNLRGSLADLAVLEKASVSGCPKFDASPLSRRTRE